MSSFGGDAMTFREARSLCHQTALWKSEMSNALEASVEV